MKNSKVYDCTMLELDRHHSNRKGNISVMENDKTVPFQAKRLYYLYDVPGGESRGAHGHKQLYQLIIAASGSFSVTLDDGEVKRTFLLNRPYQGLMVVPGIWRTLDDFSSGSVCLVLASEVYDAGDYIRSYDEFLKYKMYEAPEMLRLQVETEGGFAGSLNETPSGSTAVQDWTYTNDTADSDTWN